MKKFTLLVGALLIAGNAFAAQFTAPVVTALSNTMTIGMNYTNAPGAKVLDVPQGRGLALMADLVGSSALVVSNAVGIGWAFSLDGTTFQTSSNQLFWQLVWPNGTTRVLGYTNIPFTFTWGATKVKIVQVTNGTLAATNMSIYLTNVSTRAGG